MKILASFLVLACALTFAGGQETSSCSLAQDLNNYCDARRNRHGDNTVTVTGPKGRVGKAGPKGDKGVAGPSGLKGDSGQAGEGGIAGLPGPAGDRGPQGIVNYTAVEEMITRTVDEAFQRRWDKTNGWTTFQRRQDGTVDFNRVWDEYVNGFGNPDGEFWMGLEKLHIMTFSGNYKLRIDLRDWDENLAYAEYSEFSVGSSSTNYRLLVSGYSGTAGDSLINPRNSKHIHNGMAFTAKNSDNDPWRDNCAESYKGGWWFNDCYSSSLNGVYYRGGKYTGVYGDGIVWYPWKNDWWYSMKFVEMKLRPAQ